MLRFLRSALHMLFLVVTVIPWSLAGIALSPFVSKAWLYRFCRVWLRMAAVSAGPLLGIGTRVHGLENLPGGAQPVVLLSKHQSALETFLLPTLVPHPLAYVFKRELTRIPFFGWIMARLDMVQIDRGRPAEAFARVVSQGRRLLGQGVWIIMFPEGTRIARGQRGKYRSGGARLAIECGALVVPVAVTSARCWPPRAFIKSPGIVDVAFGPPIASQGRKADELMREVEGWIEAEMQRLDPQAYAGAAAEAAGSAESVESAESAESGNAGAHDASR